MINQRLYPDITLGFGKLPSQSIGMVGCYQVSILQGLLDRGYLFSVKEWNQYLKDHGIYSASAPTVISSSLFPSKCPDIFTEGRNEAWNDTKLINYLKDPSYIVLGEVNAKGIGGSGQHFVYIQRCDVSGGKITMTYVGDPWGGLNDQKITTRYNAYKLILSLRVFRIKKKQEETMAANYYPRTEPHIDLNNSQSVMAAIDSWVKVASGQTVDKTKHDADIQAAKDQGNRDREQAVKDLEQAVRNRLANILGVGGGEELSELYDMVQRLKDTPAAPAQSTDPNPDPSKYEFNGLVVHQDNRDYNYKIKAK